MRTIHKRRILGVDYGARRVGLAKSDPFRGFAQPVGTCSPGGVAGTIEKLRAEDGVETIVVGYPLNSDGSRNRMTAAVDRFIDELRETFPDVAIERIDEHGSSREAGRILVEAGTSRKERQRKGRLDTAAACLLLQSYLDAANSAPD